MASSDLSPKQSARLRAYRGVTAAATGGTPYHYYSPSTTPFQPPPRPSLLPIGGRISSSSPGTLSSNDDERLDTKQHEEELSVLRNEKAELERRCRGLEEQCEALRSAQGVDGIRSRVEASFNEVMMMRTSLDNDMAAFDAEKREFQRVVMDKVDLMVQAYKDKVDAELQRYKTEAARAQESLHSLHRSLQSEGFDVGISSFLSTRKVPNVQGDQSVISLNAETNQVVLKITEDLLANLMVLQERVEAEHGSPEAYVDEVKRQVYEVTQQGFQQLVLSFAQQVESVRQSHAESLSAEQKEKKELREELKLQLHLNERQVKELTIQHQTEIGVLRDEVGLHKTKLSGTGNAVLYETIEEYRKMVVEARRDSAQMQVLLEQEKDRMAHICIKLKSSLQKRNQEFETAIMRKADELVRHHQSIADTLKARVAELEEALSTVRAQPPAQTIVSIPQAPPPSTINPATFVKSAVKAGGGGKSAINTDFEKEVWEKTQELISKYKPKASGLL